MKPYDDFWNKYRGRYSQYWIHRFGMIPNLPTSYDNANSIYELMAWLQRAFKVLLDDFANLELEYEEFKNAIIEMLEVLIPQLIREYSKSEEFIELINTYIWNWWHENQENRIVNIENRLTNVENRVTIIENKLDEIDNRITNIELRITNIENRLTKIEQDINELFNQISNIWNEFSKVWNSIKQLQDIVIGGEYTILNPGSDYDLVFFNGYYTTDLPINVSIIDSNDRYLIRLSCQRLRHDNPIDMIQGHNFSLEDVPRQAMFGITFKGAYAQINTGQSMEMNQNAGSGIFNIYPKNIQATWEAQFDIRRNWSGSSFVLVFRSLADGWNDQYATNYPTIAGHTLDYGTMRYDFTVLK